MPDLPPENPHPAREPRSPRRMPPHAEPEDGTGEQTGGVDQPIDPVDDELGYLDPVDLASALSFPASDPPAISGPA